MKRTTQRAFVALTMTLLFGVFAEARHVTVSYIDANRPSEYAQTDVIAAIQRVMREWEAHNSITALVFHWGGVIQLENAPNDFNNVVIRWAPTNYAAWAALSCRYYLGCYGSPPLPTNHILLASFWDDPTMQIDRWNNPRWVPGMSITRDLVSILMHEFGHLFQNTSTHTNTSVLAAPLNFVSRYLWNTDILSIDNSRYPGHYQSLQFFAVNGNNGSVSWLREYQPSFRVLSPASLSVGAGVGNTGDYIVAYGTATPAGSSGGRNALLVKLTDGFSADVDRVVQGSFNGVAVGTTFHRPCVAVSASGTDFYLVWTSPTEDINGWRNIFAAESHNGSAITWSQPEAIGGALTRSGISCSIDRATERLVVAYVGAGEEGIWLTHRPSLMVGAGQWSAPMMVTTSIVRSDGSNNASTYGPPDIAFDFFSPTIGILTWQDNFDLLTHSVGVWFSGGTYVVGFSVAHEVTAATLRSWPLITAESNPILGVSMYSTTGSAVAGEERRSFPYANPFILASETYDVGAINATRHYTGAASNRVLFERAFLSTANTGL